MAQNDDSGQGGVLAMSPEMLQELKTEALELIENLGSQCGNLHVALQHNVEVSRDEINELFRALHTLKSLSQMASLSTVTNSLHQVEDYIDSVRQEKNRFTSDDLDILSGVQASLERIYAVFPLPIPAESLDEMESISQMFLLRAEAAGAGTSVQDESFNQGSAAEEINELALTAAESEKIDTYRKRAENFYASVFAPGTFSDLESFVASEAIDNILRVGEVLASRSNEHGSLVAFAAELDPSILTAIVGNDVLQIDKTEQALAAFGAPWSALLLCGSAGATSAANTSAGSIQNKTNNSPNNSPQASPSNHSDATADLSASLLADLEQGGAQEAEHSAGAHESAEGDHDDENGDFDTQNLSGNAVNQGMDLDPEMLQDFIQNADELIEQLSTAMLELEQNPQSTNPVEQIFRAAHTIKGTAGMFGFRAIERLCHVMENLFDRIRKGALTVNSALMDGLLFGLDRVRAMFDELKKGASSEIPINEALERLRLGTHGKSAPAAASHGAGGTTPAASAGKTSDLTATKSAVQTAAPAASSTPDGSATSGVPAVAVATSVQKDAAKNEETPVKTEAGGTIRVDLKRLDSLVNLVGELVIDRTRFARIEEELRGRNANSELCHLMTESVLLFGRHMNEVQSIIMKVRMVPVGNAFYKFARVVRDLARQCGKEIDLAIEGGETELDKTLVEEIGDPLVHLIRNSVDHGIELPDVREASGKSRRGTIKLRAYQDGNMIVIAVQDDGKGLDVSRIRTKGIQNGLIKEGETYTDKEIFGLIFEAGFSTAEKVTNISGRGVGMDVVKKNIVKLKGIIELDSAIGKGITTTIKLPLTLAIIPSLMVETKGESYAIPLVNVIESIRITPEEIQHIGSSNFVKLRDQVLPLVQLTDVFDLHDMDDRFWYRSSETEITARATRAHTATLQTTQTSRKRQSRQRLIFVVVGIGEKRVGVIVDQLLGQQEIVIKSLGQLMGRQRGVAGGCVLGNGRVALVIDVGEMIEDFSHNSKTGGKNNPGEMSHRAS